MLRYKEIKIALSDILVKMSSGDRIPSRTRLCRQLDTSRATLGKAIRELEAEGMIRSKSGSGTYVSGKFEGEVTVMENWCVIVPQTNRPIYSGIIQGVQEVAKEHGCNVIICSSDNDAEKQASFIRRLAVSVASCFILVPVIRSDIADNLRTYQMLQDSKLPFVFCNRSVEGIQAPVVTSNNFYGAYIAVKHLIRRGYRHIAYIAGSRYCSSIDRCQGYISALMEEGLEVDYRNIVFNDPRDNGDYGYTSMKTLLSSGHPIDAALCFNDMISLDVCRAIRDMGLRVSDDIGVIGYDDIGDCVSHVPPLSSISYKSFDIGRKAAEILWDMAHRRKLECELNYYLFQPSLVDRESCLGKKSIPSET